jgi:hypothetical protein
MRHTRICSVIGLGLWLCAGPAFGQEPGPAPAEPAPADAATQPAGEAPAPAVAPAPVQPAPVVAPAPVQPAPGVAAAPAGTASDEGAVAPRGYQKRSSVRFLLGPGFGLQFFYSGDVNDYLDEWVRHNSTGTEEGFTAVILAFVPRLAINFAPIPYFQIQLFGEVGWAPKVFTLQMVSESGSPMGSETTVFHYLRFSGGGTLNAHIPVAQGRKSLFFGAGAYFNRLKFEEYEANAPGVRGLVGFRFYRKRFAPEIFLAFDWSRATAEHAGDEMTLQYTGGTIGGNFYFDLVP